MYKYFVIHAELILKMICRNEIIMISHLTVFLPEHIYSNSDGEVSIDELAFIVTNKNTDDAITIAVETENADIEVRNKP